MCAILRTSGCVWAMASPQVTPSADWMFVIRKMYFGSGTALSNRKSVQPSTKIVSTLSSSATGPRAGVLPLEVIPVKKSIFSESLSRFSSLTLASVPAFSSALMISILRLPSSPPPSLISSWASTVPLYMGTVLAQEEINDGGGLRSEEHTSELQSRENLVCRLLLEKKKN